MRILAILFFLIPASICLAAPPANDDFENAFLLEDISFYRSADSEYSTEDATPDGEASSWKAPSSNVWFKFQAKTSEVGIQVFSRGAQGSITYPFVGLYDSLGVPLSSNGGTYGCYLNEMALDSGSWYYFSVDGGKGLFTLQVTDDLGYDMFANALELEDISFYRSEDAEYSTEDATPDGEASSWKAPSSNVWFKFQAKTSEVGIQVFSRGEQGSITYPFVGLYDSSGTPLSSNGGTYGCYLNETALDSGSWYYFSVDGGKGLFTLQVTDDLGYDMFANALELEDISFYRSADAEYSTEDATPDGEASSWKAPSSNVWFKFQAKTSEIGIQVFSRGEQGSITYPFVGLYDSSGTPLSSNGGTYGCYLNESVLDSGSWYYFSVDGGKGLFTLQVTDDLGYDMFANALELEDISFYRSADSEYSTEDATPDGEASSWKAPSSNVWFKFQAKTNEVGIQVFSRGAQGSITYPFVGLYDSLGAPLSSNGGTYGCYLNEMALDSGSWYYFSVDGGKGLFTLQVTDDLGYDMFANALELEDISFYRSADSEYSTEDATPDGEASSWKAPSSNVWFKFLALSNEMRIQVFSRGVEGSITYPFVGLYDSLGVPLNSIGGTYGCTLILTDLDPGKWYYFSVDGGKGKFTLEVESTMPNRIFAIASGNWSDGSIWSYTIDGPPTNRAPISTDTIWVQGHNIVIDSNAACSLLLIRNNDSQASVTVVNNELTVFGEIRIEKEPGKNETATFNVEDGGSVIVLEDQ